MSSVDPTITLTEEDDWWVAGDTETSVTSQGRSREDALDNLDEALAGYRGEGEAPTEDDLRDLGIDTENNEPGSLDESNVFG